MKSVPMGCKLFEALKNKIIPINSLPILNSHISEIEWYSAHFLLEFDQSVRQTSHKGVRFRNQLSSTHYEKAGCYAVLLQ